MVRSISNIWGTNFSGKFLSMVTPQGKNTCEPLYMPHPAKHPDSQNGWYYGTLGTPSANWIFRVFAHKDSALVYFDTEEGEKDSVYFPLGDDEHNVLDPEYGWDLSVVMDQSGSDLGFRTYSDTLTIQQGLERHIELYPGWNDENTGKVLYSAGGNFYNVEPIFTNEYHIRYRQYGDYSIGYEDLGGYAVEIPHLKDAFALEYILVRYIDGLVIPGIEVRDGLSVGDTFTVSLTGTPHLMTSWKPEIQISGVEVEPISQKDWVYTYKLKSKGTMKVSLHHNSLQVLPDTSLTRSVQTSDIDEVAAARSAQISPNPITDQAELRIESAGSAPILIDIYDARGYLVHTATHEPQPIGTATIKLDFRAFPADMYNIVVNNKDTYPVVKL